MSKFGTHRDKTSNFRRLRRPIIIALAFVGFFVISNYFIGFTTVKAGHLSMILTSLFISFSSLFVVLLYLTLDPEPPVVLPGNSDNTNGTPL